MRAEKLIISTVTGLLLAVVSCTSSSKIKQGELSTKEIALSIIESSGTCTLISIDSTGQPKARVMDPFLPSDNFEIWFGTNSLSRKVSEILTNDKVTVHYYDKSAAAYVSIYGSGSIHTEEALKRKYWKKKWADFYPNYPQGYSLIKVQPFKIELISEKHGITGDSINWQPESVLF